MGDVICKNCGEHWADCTCYDVEDELNNGHLVLALRLHNNLIKSDFLQAKEEFWKKIK